MVVSPIVAVIGSIVSIGACTFICNVLVFVEIQSTNIVGFRTDVNTDVKRR